MTTDEDDLVAVTEPLADVLQAGHTCPTCDFVGDLRRAAALLQSDWLAGHDRQQREQALEAVRPAIDVFAQLTEAWAHLRMDTDDDQRLHDRLVALSRQAIRAARHIDTAETTH